MKQPCGCCAGIEIITPQPEANRPGLPAIAYRVGTYATFLESMLARLSTLYLDVPEGGAGTDFKRICPLTSFTTRDLSDPSVALMDAWAIVANVLSFYQERIANEGYLRTAVERLSILELARLVGYRLRPAVSASVYLAFTVADGFNGAIPRGTRAQSIPGAGEKPQFFETYEDLPARDAWNTIKPRLSRPQLITLPGQKLEDNMPVPTGADVIDTLYFQGTSTNLNTGNALLIALGDEEGEQTLRKVRSVNIDAANKRTEVVLEDIRKMPVSGKTLEEAATNALLFFIDQASVLFADNGIAGNVSSSLQNVLNSITSDTTKTEAVGMFRAIIPNMEDKREIAVQRNFTRLEPWIENVIGAVNALIKEIPNLDVATGEGGSTVIAKVQTSSPLENLTNIIGRLSLPPSLQPANAQRLARTVKQTFSPRSDMTPRLLAAFHPAAAGALYKAWAGVKTPSGRVEVHALRARAGLFPGTYPGAVTIKQTKDNGNTTTTTSYISPNIDNAWKGLYSGLDPLKIVALDAVYENLREGGWIGIDRPVLDRRGNPVQDEDGRKTTFHKIATSRTISMSTDGYTAKVTQLTVEPPWLYDLAPDDQPQIRNDFSSTEFLHGTIVYFQSDPLVLAEEPLDADVEGSSIELAQLYDGLEPGRWIVVSGERTDIADTTGVTASELVMISSVEQGARSIGCKETFPLDLPPFSKYFYTTEANRYGDRLVVGLLGVGYKSLESNFPNPPAYTNKRYCDQVQLAPGVYANAYVPTAAELDGNFQDFEGLLYDPTSPTGEPYPSGKIPIFSSTSQPQVFAWRISTEPVHTILKLANEGLAYTYDRNTVTINGNVVKATHGQSVAEVLGNGDASQAQLKFTLHQPPLTHLSAPTPSGEKSTLTVRINDLEWQEADNLLALGPGERGYITRTDDSGRTTVIFGNGEHGARTPTGNANVKAIYRSGTGREGNVRAQQISQLVTQPPGAKYVINPLPATGGADGDTRDQARRNAPLPVMALDRLVSVRDYADFTRTFAGIGKASATRLTDGRKIVVHVTIAGKDDIPIDQNSDLYINLVQALLQNGDPYQPIQVALRRLKLLVISAGVKIKPNYAWESVKPDIESVLLDYYGFDRRDLGQSVFLSEAIGVMQAVEGVEYVDMRTFDAVAEGIDARKLAGLGGSLELKDFVEAQLARVDPAAADQAKRILPAELAILTPDISGTLILTEITQ